MPLVLTVTIPDSSAADAQAALSAVVNLTSTAANAKAGLIEIVRQRVIARRTAAAATAAATTAQTQAVTDLSGIS